MNIYLAAKMCERVNSMAFFQRAAGYRKPNRAMCVFYIRYLWSFTY